MSYSRLMISAFLVMVLMTGMSFADESKESKCACCGDKAEMHAADAHQHDNCAPSTDEAALMQACQFKSALIDKQAMLYIRTTLSHENMSVKMGELFHEILACMQEENVEMAGQPFSIYYGTSDEGVDMAVGIPTSVKAEGNTNVSSGFLPGGEVITGSYLGPYEELPEAHRALDRYLAENNRSAVSPVWEVYVTDPGAEPDKSKWRTDLFVQVN